MHSLIRITTFAAALLLPNAGHAAPRSNADSSGGARVAQMCDAGSRNVTGLSVDQYRQTLKLSDDQRAALDALTAAVTKATQDLKAACPSERAASATAGLAHLEKRIEAMSAAVAAIRPSLETFYGLLNDEQKEQVIAIAQRSGRDGLLDQDCGAVTAGFAGWPAADIERAVHPSDVQRANLDALQDAVAKSADIAKGACRSESLLTPTARLDAVGKRLDSLLQSVKTVRAPLDEAYGTLDEEQKARFDAVAQSQGGAAAEPSRAKPSVHRHHFISFGYLVRRFLHAF
jgi:hypothetical protein